jgi:hypothetical protein
MFGYISSTRKKACEPCVKVKRRCDLGYPECERCVTKGLICAYPTLVHESKVVVKQVTPDFRLAAPGLALNTVNDGVAGNVEGEPAVAGPCSSTRPDTYSLPDPSPELFASLRTPLALELTTDDNLAYPEAIKHDELPQSILETALPQIWEPRFLSTAQVSDIVREVCSFVPAMAYSGHTVFLHSALYTSWQPPAYQDACALSALYMARTPRNVSILTNSINTKIQTLINDSATWTIYEHLAAVQALLIYQVIRLFDPSLQQTALADQHNALLDLWAGTLWKRAFNEQSRLDSSYEAWIFHESLRRTVWMSVFLRGAWCSVTKGGLCEQIPVVARLPLTRGLALWDSENGGGWAGREGGGSGLEGEMGRGLIAYGDLTYSWRPRRSRVELSAFERLLIVSCRWEEDAQMLRV